MRKYGVDPEELDPKKTLTDEDEDNEGKAKKDESKANNKK